MRILETPSVTPEATAQVSCGVLEPLDLPDQKP